MLKKLFKGKPKPKPQAKAGVRSPKTVKEAFGPPLTPQEVSGNLSTLERELNQKMVCPAGRNQVFIRSLLTRNGGTQPRIALKCHLRRDMGEDQHVFFQHIVDCCTGDPSKCAAHEHFKNRLNDL